MLTIALNKGLDHTSPAMAKEPGSLIGCMNYEFTTLGGISRIDGTELYDGWANGALTDVWAVNISISDAGAFSSVQAGDIIKLITDQGTFNVGVYISHGGNELLYCPITKDQSVLRAGDEIIVDGGSTVDANTISDAVGRHSTETVDNYVDLVRAIATILRASIETSPTPVCGLHWFRNNLLEFRDAPSYVLNGVSNSFTEVGDTLRIGTIDGLVIAKTTSPLTVWIEPYVEGTASTSISVRNKDNTAASTATASSVTEHSGESDWSYCVARHTPQTHESRGAARMYRSIIVTFDNGTQAASADPSVGDIVNVGPAFASNHYKMLIKSVVLTSGSWSAGNATGRVELIPFNPLDPLSGASGPGAYNKIVVGDVVRINGNNILTVDSIIRTNVAGTKKLRQYESHFVGLTANFYGIDEDAEAYLATGASRAVWAKFYSPPRTGYAVPLDVLELGLERYASYGSIITDPDVEANDKPKWAGRHARLCLSLGYLGGTVNLSVPNEPSNFSGIDGAQTFPMGDEITGLLEGVGDSTLVFGRRSISRLAGIGDNIATETISPDSGALPYSCVNVGRVPVFADQNGVSVLEQSSTYSDFMGYRASDKVQAQLKPKMVVSLFDTEIGGVHCAMPVRGKNQYRLFLRSGDVYSFCMTGEQPLIAMSNYSNDGVARLPLAWSSQVQDNGQERMHVVWDVFYGRYAATDYPYVESNDPVDGTRVYELDSGWGFNGITFTHYFELAHLYNDNASNFLGVEGIRLFGKSHGMANLVVKAKGIERDFDQSYTTASQDISLPYTPPAHFYRSKQDVTNFVDHANWGLGVSLRIEGGQASNLSTVEPSHIVQVMVVYPRVEGHQDG